MRADNILVVMDGRIIEEGSHEHLLSKRGKYYDLWSKQLFLMPAFTEATSQEQHKAKYHEDTSKKLQKYKSTNDIPATHKVENIRNVFNHLSKAQNSPAKDSTATQNDTGQKYEVRPDSKTDQ